MGKLAGRPVLQDLVKAAMVESAARVRVSDEARFQRAKLASDDEKDEDKKCEKCGKEKCSCGMGMKSAHVEKLASALDFIAVELSKSAADMAGPYNLTEHLQESPPGVMQATSSTPLPDHKGQGVHVVPMHPGTQKAMPQEHGGTQMANTIDDAPQLHQEMMESNYGKKASALSLIRQKLAAEAVEKAEKEEDEGIKQVRKGLEHFEHAHASEPENHGKKEGSAPKRLPGPVPAGLRPAVKALIAGGAGAGLAGAAYGAKKLYDKKKSHTSESSEESKAAGVHDLVAYMTARVKQAEDAINPAQISAGPAVPPDTNMAGEPGGTPVGGAPQGPTHLVGSADAARAYSKGQAYANRKQDLAQYFAEPALQAAHDKTLQVAFDNTSNAGPKIASASVKTAAARALLSKLASSIDENNKGM
jgi:hypothetical protein